MSATYFAIKLRDAKHSVETLGMLPFGSIDDVVNDVCAAIPDTVADLLRRGISPLGYSFIICDDRDKVLHEVDFHSALASPEPRKA